MASRASTAFKLRASPEDAIVETLDDLHRQSRESKDALLGPEFGEKVKRFYNFDVPGAQRINYHPLIRVADLQMLNLREASQLTAPTPQFFISNRGQRKEDKEKAMRGMWNALNYSMEFLHAEVYAGMAGTAIMQCYFDPDYNSGAGAMRVRFRDLTSYFPDPSAHDDEERAFIIIEDWMTLEEIAARYGPRAASKLKPNITGGRIPKTWVDFPAMGGGLPPGPMRNMGALGGGAFANNQREPSNRMRVRTMFIKDSTTLPFNDELGFRLIEDKILPDPKEVPAFPTGRLIVEAQRELLFDGPNPYRTFPYFRLSALPPLLGYFAPPPIRYTQDLQQLSEEMFSQVYENAFRTNNVMMFVNRQSGLTSNDISGLPGMVYFTDPQAGNSPVQIVVPPTFPAHFLEYPKTLLQMQRDLWGATPSRQGQNQAGNVGTGLFQDQVYQSQEITRLRARYLADAIQRVSEFCFYTMLDVGGTQQFPVPEDVGLSLATWERGDLNDLVDDWQLTVDSASLRIDSPSALRNLALNLARMGKIADKDLFEWLEVPDAEARAARADAQRQQEAIIAANQPKKGKK